MSVSGASGSRTICGFSVPARTPGLVGRDPGAAAVAEPPRADRAVLPERLGRLACGPAAAILERWRRVPVEERRERLDASSEQLVDEPVVEVESRLVHAA